LLSKRNLYRYAVDVSGCGRIVVAGGGIGGGLYKFNPVVTHRLKPPGLVTQPLHLKCDMPVPKFAFSNFQLVPLHIGGGAVAVALQSKGFDVVVLEADESFDARKQGYGLTVQVGGCKSRIQLNP
jgi:hypothetical protein